MAIIRIPTLIDPHFHLINSQETDWKRLADAAFMAGYSSIQVMPDFAFPIIDQSSLLKYKSTIPELPIKVWLTAAGTTKNSQQLKRLTSSTKAVKVWLGTGPEELLVTKEEELRKIIFSTDKIVMIHAEDEATLLANYELNNQSLNLAMHNTIFDRFSAIRATVKAISAAKATGRKVYICHISTAEELELIREAKSQGIRIFAEVSPPHLFLNESDLDRLDTLGKINPPLRSKADQTALWKGVNDGTIDTIGSDSYCWPRSVKDDVYDRSPSRIPSFELTLPLMITAVKNKLTTLDRVISLTSTNPAKIFKIPRSSRSLFVDLDNPHPYKIRYADWHPFNTDMLVGWPINQFYN